ncbi:DinB family protein [Paenibacillus turpanensis]|uniref:DinB family protein n=1 Tax=Paenibacillus turpanensis TaxID=2689078 RepID=UPI00140BA66D|nr:DinB family protein [Paenibacillus turpanensis]
MFTRPEANEYASFYEGYIRSVPEGDLLVILKEQQDELVRVLKSVPQDKEDHRYAADKWTIKQVAGHIVDTERIMGYRLLCVSRGESQSLPGFDQDSYAAAGGHEGRTLADITEEFVTLRQSTISLIRGIPESAWTRTGVMNSKNVSARAIACVIAGHELHHRVILEKQYLGK